MQHADIPVPQLATLGLHLVVLSYYSFHLGALVMSTDMLWRLAL